MANPSNEKSAGRIATFYEEVREESRRVTWPTREKAWQAVVIVLALAAVLAVYIGAIDLVLSRFYLILL